MSKVLTSVVILLSLASVAKAEEKYSFGMGEKYSDTSQPWNPCGSNPETVAQETCSVHMPSKTIVRFGYTVDLATNVVGGECGYSKYLLSCYSMPPVAENRIKRFVVGDNPVTGCGTDTMAVAREFCTVKGPTPIMYPFTIRRTLTTDGGHCGYNHYEVKCRTPFPPRVSAKQ